MSACSARGLILPTPSEPKKNLAGWTKLTANRGQILSAYIAVPHGTDWRLVSGRIRLRQERCSSETGHCFSRDAWSATIRHPRLWPGRGLWGFLKLLLPES
jgi:hypothetical protein